MKKILKETDLNSKKKVWTIYTRIFHVLLVATITMAYLTTQAENNIINHVLTGYVIAIIVFFRIVWGFIGVKCSRHQDLVKKAPGIIKYYKDLFLKNKEVYNGHNPASSLYVLLIMISLVLITVSGALLYGIQENSGIFASLNHNYSDWMLIVEFFHKTSTTALLFLIAVHITGITLNLMLDGTDTIMSMVNGKKNGTNFDVTLTVKQETFAIVCVVCTISAMVYFYNNPDNILTENHESEINFRKDSYETSSSCGSCHLVYPAYLLPKQSWNKMIDNLEDHFGKDASLPEEDTQIVRNYLMSHAAEYSTREAAIKVLDNLQTDTPQEITKTNYWKNTHKDITKEEFEADYGIKTDCTTCHKTIKDGLIQDEKIKFKFK